MGPSADHHAVAPTVGSVVGHRKQSICPERVRPALGLVSLDCSLGVRRGRGLPVPISACPERPTQAPGRQAAIGMKPRAGTAWRGLESPAREGPKVESVVVGLGGQDLQAVTVPRDPSVGFPGSCFASKVAKGTGLPTTYPQPVHNTQALPALGTHPILPFLGKCWSVWLGAWLTSEPQFLHWWGWATKQPKG